jgi:serine/threonine-protein kinase
MTRQSDIFSASVVLWEAIAGRRLFRGDNEADTLYNVLQGVIERPSAYAKGVPPALDAVVLRGLERDPNKRFKTALEMATELEKTIGFVSPRSIAEWVEEVARDKLALRQAQLAEIECVSSAGFRIPSNPPPTLPAPSSTSDDSVGASALSLSTHARRRRSIAVVGTVAALGLALLVWRVVSTGRATAPGNAPAASPPALTALTTAEPSPVPPPSATVEETAPPAASESAESAPSGSAPPAASQAEPPRPRVRQARERTSRSKRSTSKKPGQPVYSRE